MKVELYIGIEKDKNNNQLSNLDVNNYLDSFESWLCLTIGGYSSQLVQGGYKLANGDICEEVSIKYELLLNSQEQLEQLQAGIKTIKGQLNQESVLVVIIPQIELKFI